MSDAPYDNPSMRKGVDDYTGNSKGRRGGQPLLIRPDKYRQLIGGFFWGEVGGDDGDEVFINDGLLEVGFINLSTWPPTYAEDYQLVSDDTAIGLVAGDIVSLKVTRVTDERTETFTDNDSNTITSRQKVWNMDALEIVTTAGYPADDAATKFFPLVRFNGPFDITQLSFGILELPAIFVSSVANESP